MTAFHSFHMTQARFTFSFWLIGLRSSFPVSLLISLSVPVLHLPFSYFPSIYSPNNFPFENSPKPLFLEDINKESHPLVATDLTIVLCNLNSIFLESSLGLCSLKTINRPYLYSVPVSFATKFYLFILLSKKPFDYICIFLLCEYYSCPFFKGRCSFMI